MNRKKIFGFTLVELLIVVSVIAIMSSLGIAAYVNFNRTQIIVQTTDKIISDLRLAQSLASNNQRPTRPDDPTDKQGFCGSAALSGYSFRITGDHSYGLFAVCSSTPLSEMNIHSVTVPSVIHLTPLDWRADFKVLRQGVSFSRPGTNITVGNEFNKPVKEIIVGEGGEIRLKGNDEED
jgi:prepilin-type N-terminal cleavage/methylation domain-containing protein